MGFSSNSDEETARTVLEWLIEASGSAIPAFEVAQLTEDSISHWLTSVERRAGDDPGNQVWEWLTGPGEGLSPRPDRGRGADEQARIAEALRALRNLLEDHLAQRLTDGRAPAPAAVTTELYSESAPRFPPHSRGQESGSTSLDHAEEAGPILHTIGWLDGHGTAVARLAELSTKTPLHPHIPSGAAEHGHLAEFGASEHGYLGLKGLQPMIDGWALGGLIAGGAFVQDTTNDGAGEWLDHWQFFLPNYKNPTAPYAALPERSLAPWHWHWIIPDADTDKNGKPWTPDSLKAELKAGTAATLSIGDIILLSGDLVERFADFKNAGGPNWRPGPVNVMKGYERLEPFALTTIRLVQFPRTGLDRLNDVRLLARNQNDYAALGQEIRRGDPYWNRTKAIVEYLKKARGPTGCSELLVLSRMLRHEATNLGVMNVVTPWIRDDERRALQSQLNAKDVAKANELGLDWNSFKNRGFHLELMQFVLSNGHYADLALRNNPHFAPDNWKHFEVAHEAALRTVDNLMRAPLVHRHLAPIPADAVALTAFGLHFLSDAFSAGHMRVPRGKLGQRWGLLSKVMHDIDGKIGLYVENGLGQQWRAFGDGFLETREKWQEDLVARLPRIMNEGITVDANKNRCIAGMSAAMKQLHYQAQKYLNSPGAEAFQAVLQKHRGDQHGLWYDGFALGDPGDFGAGRDAWIAMDIPAKLAFLRKHEPHPLASGSDWLSSKSLANVPELVLADGSINRSGGYEWEQHLSKGYNDRMIRLSGLGDVLDITDLYQLALNMPSGASAWYGSLDEGIQLLLRTIPERPPNPPLLPQLP